MYDTNKNYKILQVFRVHSSFIRFYYLLELAECVLCYEERYNTMCYTPYTHLATVNVLFSQNENKQKHHHHVYNIQWIDPFHIHISNRKTNNITLIVCSQSYEAQNEYANSVLKAKRFFFVQRFLSNPISDRLEKCPRD